MPELPIDHDRLFKQLITTLFFEFISLFAPQIADVIDRDSIEFIDKEVFSELMPGKENEADILVKVRIAGEERFVLIHIENQSSSQAEFMARMFDYFKKLHTKYGMAIYPIAVFSFSSPKRPEPFIYSETVFGMEVMRYQFHAVQLNLMRWQDYLGSDNPIATALMSKMNVRQEDRITIRKECLRMFVTLKLDFKKVRVINEFMGTYLKLTTEETRQLLKEIETTMPQKEKQEYYVYLNEFEALAREEGIEQGIQQGVERGVQQGIRAGEVRFALRLLQSKFGTLDETLSGRILRLETTQLEALGVALLNFGAVSELQHWLDTNA